MGCTGVTVLGVYSFVASLIIIVMGVMINTNYCGEMLETDDCKDITVGNGGKVTEVHNKMIKVDLFNSDNAEMGRVTSGESECPPCTFSAFTALEIVAITLLVVGIVTNIGRLVRYVIKAMKKRSLRATEAKIKRDEETKKKLHQEIEIELGRGKCTSSMADLT